MDGGWTARQLTRTLPLIEQKRIEDIIDLAAMAPVVAGARLGENATPSPGPCAA